MHTHVDAITSILFFYIEPLCTHIVCFPSRASYQQNRRRDVEYLSGNVLFIESFVEFCDIILSSHLTLNVVEVVQQLLVRLISLPNIPTIETHKDLL